MKFAFQMRVVAHGVIRCMGEAMFLRRGPMYFGKMALSAVASAVALSSPAAAQERTLNFGLGANVEYNSNVARSSKERAALRGLTPEDTIFKPAATVDFFSPIGRQSVFLKGMAGYTFYDRNDELNREVLDFNGGVNGQLGPCAATVQGGYSRGMWLLDDPTLVENVENIQTTKTVGANVACSRSTGLGITASASKDWVDNDSDQLASSDSERTSVMGGLTYSRPALGTITVFADRQETSYPNRLLEGGYTLDAYGVTFARQLGARIQGTVTVAYNKVNQKTPAFLGPAGDMETTAYSAELSYRATSRLSFQGSFDRAITPTVAAGRSYDLSEGYRLSGVYDLGSRVSISAGGAWVQRQSKGLLPTTPLELTDSETTSYFAAVRYRQSKRLSFVLNAGREERTTNAPQFDYTNNRIGFGADLTF